MSTFEDYRSKISQYPRMFEAISMLIQVTVLYFTGVLEEDNTPEKMARDLTMTVTFAYLPLQLLKLMINKTQEHHPRDALAKPMAGQLISPALIISAVYLGQKYVDPLIADAYSAEAAFASQVMGVTVIWDIKVWTFYACSLTQWFKAPYQPNPTAASTMAETAVITLIQAFFVAAKLIFEKLAPSTNPFLPATAATTATALGVLIVGDAISRVTKCLETTKCCARLFETDSPTGGQSYNIRSPLVSQDDEQQQQQHPRQA